MTRKLVTTLIILILTISTAWSQPRLGDNVTPTSQIINLTVDPKLADYTGRVTIDLVVYEACDSFRIHAEELDILSIALVQSKSHYQVSHEKLGKDQLILKTDLPMKPGQARLMINFKNNFNTDAIALYRVDLEDDAYLYTQMEADEARESFPCFDEPNFKIPHQIIITAPFGYEVVSNMPEQ